MTSKNKRLVLREMCFIESHALSTKDIQTKSFQNKKCGFSFQIDTFNYHNKIHVIFRFQMIPSYKIHAVSFDKSLLNKRNMFSWSCTEEQ